MKANKLKLSQDKTESLLIESNRTSLPNSHPTFIHVDHVGNINIPFSFKAKILSVTLFANLSLEKHVTKVRKSVYIEIKRIRSIRHYLTIEATKNPVCAFVLSKLDYCNSLLSGSLKHFLDKLTRV